MLGLAVDPVCALVREPERLHRWVSGDPSVRPEGTRLPLPPGDGVPLTLAEVRAAASAITRTTDAGLRVRGPARSLVVRASRALTDKTSEEIAAAVGLESSAVRHVSSDERDPAVALTRRVARDPRFALLRDNDLRRDPAWRAYAGYR